MRKILFCLIGSVLIMFSCDKEEKESNLKIISISGFTERDAMGNYISPKDTTDWRFDDKWSVKEEQLFDKQFPKLNYNKSYLESDSFIKPVKAPQQASAYPNPTTDLIFIFMNKDSMSYFDIRIVDSTLNIIKGVDSIKRNITLSFDSTIYHNKKYRIYYKVQTTNNMIFKGHGDIKIN